MSSLPFDCRKFFLHMWNVEDPFVPSEVFIINQSIDQLFIYSLCLLTKILYMTNIVKWPSCLLYFLWIFKNTKNAKLTTFNTHNQYHFLYALHIYIGVCSNMTRNGIIVYLHTNPTASPFYRDYLIWYYSQLKTSTIAVKLPCYKTHINLIFLIYIYKYIKWIHCDVKMTIFSQNRRSITNLVFMAKFSQHFFIPPFLY